MFSRKEIEGKVIDVVTETLALDAPAKLENSFRDDLSADSIDIVTLLITLQDELNNQFDVSDLQGKDTLIDVVNYIEQRFMDNIVPA